MIKWVDSNYLGWYLIEYKNITGYLNCSKYDGMNINFKNVFFCYKFY